MQQQQKVKKMEENLTILRRCSLFAGLSDTQTAALLQSLHPVRRSSDGKVEHIEELKRNTANRIVHAM